MLQIVQSEDERRWDSTLIGLLKDQNASVRRRAALAAGRIGDTRAVPFLAGLLTGDSDQRVQEMAAFALGEIESWEAAPPLLTLLRNNEAGGPVRARAVEALGKISSTLQTEQEKQKTELNTVIGEVLKLEAERSNGDEQIILLALTATLRARATGAGPTVVQLLGHSNSRIRADAANTLARLRLKEGGNKLRDVLVADNDPIVRANAARALGAAEDKEAFDPLLDRALKDQDLRVRVSAIRALGALKDKRGGTPLLDRGYELLDAARKQSSVRPLNSKEILEVLEIASTLGLVLQNTKENKPIAWLRDLRNQLLLTAPEVEIAYARIAPQLYAIDLASSLIGKDSREIASPEQSVKTWRQIAVLGQGATVLASLKSGDPIVDASIKEQITGALHARLTCPQYSAKETRRTIKPGDVVAARCIPVPPLAVSDLLRAYSAFKPNDLASFLRDYLKASDVIVRSTAADLIGDLPPDKENADALAQALPGAMKDDLNDAALSILDSLAKQKTAAANESVKSALQSSDHLIRRRAVALLKTNGAGDFSDRIGTVKTIYTQLDYKRALGRAGKITRATVTTTKGSFVIEFLPDDAPLTVDNFVRLAQKGYFNGQTIPRVVPNFVVQAGDPRGDQNGGPGYSIRCEINEVPYARAALGMALSGKDTGGSQWFVTHSPQPHLDGGYTVFGRVVSGMEIVDNITRGDLIRSVTISERRLPRDESSSNQSRSSH